VAGTLPKGTPEALAALTVAAQSSGGEFTLEDLAILAGGQNQVEEGRCLLEGMVADGLVIEACRQGAAPRSAYRFAEDSVPPYLWLLAVKARVSSGHDADGPIRASNTGRSGL
jgi:hypothetical protein